MSDAIVERTHTPISDALMREMIVLCHTSLFGSAPTRRRLMVLWSVLAFEHGAGADVTAPADGRAGWHVFNWDFGNRRGVHGDIGAFVMSAAERINGRVSEVNGIWPAFSDAEHGMTTWLLMLSTTYRMAWAASLTGNILLYSAAAQLAGYFTDKLAHYADGVRTWAKIFYMRWPK